VKDDISEPLARLTQMTYNRLKAGTEKHHRLFYLGNVFDDVTGDIWFDAVHVAPEGNHIVAERIINVLNKEGIIAAANHRAISAVGNQPNVHAASDQSRLALAHRDR